jgi:hypothetical protein
MSERRPFYKRHPKLTLAWCTLAVGLTTLGIVAKEDIGRRLEKSELILGGDENLGYSAKLRGNNQGFELYFAQHIFGCNLPLRKLSDCGVSTVKQRRSQR